MTGHDLREFRRRYGLSAQRFAALVGLADGRTIRRYEAGDVPVPPWLTLLCAHVDALPALQLRLGIKIVKSFDPDRPT